MGLRFNEAKLLLDPYAKAVTGKCRNVDNLLLPYDPRARRGRTASSIPRDNTTIVPKCIVVDDAFDWQGDDVTRPRARAARHLRGARQGLYRASFLAASRFPGTYLGFIEKIPHLTRLGVNAVELLPVHEFYVDDFLAQKGLTNYWGYNSIGFFAPGVVLRDRRAPGCQVAEFKTLVRELHRAGIKVILDVVYNHTGEGNELGPTLCASRASTIPRTTA